MSFRINRRDFLKAAGAALVQMPLLYSGLAYASASKPNAGHHQKAKLSNGPLVVIGIDGLEWDLMLPMIQQGKLPHLTSIANQGYYGKLETFMPTMSPIIWTSIATGKTYQNHGIRHFVKHMPNGKLSLYTNLDRKTKALWNIASDFGKQVSVIGWWMTYPVDEINGLMVSQTNTISQINVKGGKNVWKGSLLKGVHGQVHPPFRQNEIFSILNQVEMEMPELLMEVFGKFDHPMSALGKRLWNNCRWAFRADETYRRIALKVAQETPSQDLALIYIGGTDVVSHRFWRYMQPDLYQHKPHRNQIQNFGTVIADYYQYADRVAGQITDAYGPNATYLVISDHGFKPINMDARFDPNHPPEDVNSAHHQKAPPGVLLASGPAIQKACLKPLKKTDRTSLKTVGSVFDIAPTLLAMMKIPVGKDMDGKVLEDMFTPEAKPFFKPQRVATHDTEEFHNNRRKSAAMHPGRKDRLKQLRSLGYIK